MAPVGSAGATGVSSAAGVGDADIGDPAGAAAAVYAARDSGLSAEQKRLTTLFDASFRIQREACEAAGRHIPLVVESGQGGGRRFAVVSSHSRLEADT